MATYCVYHTIHVRTPHQLIPKLFIIDVPPDKSVDWNMVDELDWFGEFNIPHANHKIAELTKDSSPNLKRAFRGGNCKMINYQSLVDLSNTIEPEGVSPLVKRKRKVRDTFNRCNNPDIIEQIARLLNL